MIISGLVFGVAWVGVAVLGAGAAKKGHDKAKGHFGEAVRGVKKSWEKRKRKKEGPKQIEFKMRSNRPKKRKRRI